MPGLDLVLRLRVVVIEVRLFKVRDVARIPLEFLFYPVYLSFVTIFSAGIQDFLSSWSAFSLWVKVVLIVAEVG